MILVHDRMARGRTETGWLDSRHTFSFGHFHDPRRMGFRALRVINEDRVVPGAGFPPHSHADMEIISYVLEGALEHRDSLGNGSVIRPGEVQRMSAGTGIAHSEYNPSATAPVHFLQIWIMPQQRGMAPSYEQKRIAEADKRGRLSLAAGPERENGAVTIHQDARLYLATLAPGQTVIHDIAKGRHAWVQIARGAAMLNGDLLKEGDGAAISDEARISLEATGDCEFLVFDLA